MNALILTDHTAHSSENSLYSLAVELVLHKHVARVDVASKKSLENNAFFSCRKNADLWITEVDENFEFKKKDHPLDKLDSKCELKSYDFIWLRLPPPLSESFLHFLDRQFKGKVIINNPLSILETGSKAFLLNFIEVCPPLQLCNSAEDILNFSQRFPIVLKPLREYGGRGILKIENNRVSNGIENYSFDEFLLKFEESPTEYLAVKYLRNVKQGDKRIIVIDGEIMGASLRLPKQDSWLCNIAMGGTSQHTEVLAEEVEIVKVLNPILGSKGIVMYGVDTLMGDYGKRVLSEINTTSIGGLPQMARLQNTPLVKIGVNLIVNNILNRLK